jgi:hypothetical protein
MQFFTALLSALALAASTTTASPITARQNYNPQILYPYGAEFWQAGSRQTVRWDLAEVHAHDFGLTGELFLGNDLGGSELISLKLLPNLLCFTVVVTQQYLSFACTCNPLYSHAAYSLRPSANGWGGNHHRAERVSSRVLFYYS